MSKYKIYPSIGIARLGNAEATQDDAVFSPEIPWANLYETDNNYRTPDGKLKKQAQRFYIYECKDDGTPIGPINEDEFEITWSAEVANKKGFWYDFNNSLDLSVQLANHNNLSPRFFEDKIAPGIDASYRNPNVLKEKGAFNNREELVNSPGPVSITDGEKPKKIQGYWPYPKDNGVSKVAAQMGLNSQPVSLGTMEYDKGTLVFYGADGLSAALNPSDLNTDFADNSNWYDDICDGRITATITPKGGKPIHLNDADSAAWVASAPPDYAPQIQPISTMFDLIMGANDKDTYNTDFSLVFPMLYRLYRMQWVNLGDFLAPSFRETIDQLGDDFKWLYDNSPEGFDTRNRIFMLFRDPEYNFTNEPIIPSKETTDLAQRNVGREELKLPYYPGDGINYPGSPAQWFAVPPLLYEQLKNWRDGQFASLEGTYGSMDDIGHYYQQQFLDAAKDESKRPLLMTRAVLETLYGGGFHPGVELTWPLRHKQMYAKNDRTVHKVTPQADLYGLREIRLNAATQEQQDKIFYNDFGLQINAQDIQGSITAGSDEPHWFWLATPGDLTKWMGIPWQSDAGSCQAVFTDSQYPVPAWWAANLPVDVLTEDSLAKIQDPAIGSDTRQNIYANRLPWLQTTDTGFVGYHAEGGYMNGLIAMVYQWKNIGVVTGRLSNVTDVNDVPETVYVSFDNRNRRDKNSVFLGKAIKERNVEHAGEVFYTNTRESIWIPTQKQIFLSSKPDGTGDVSVDDVVVLNVNGEDVFTQDFSNNCSGRITPSAPIDLGSALDNYRGNFTTVTITYKDKCGGKVSATNFYLVFK